MIPKILHYCWFGKGKKPASFKNCLESWKKYCPDFEIKEWNESNVPNRNQNFFKNALRKKRYAFVADSARASILYDEGGVYLDTDMLLLKPIDVFLKYDFFIGEEIRGRIAFGLFGGIAKHPFLKQMTNFYEESEFNDFSPPVITHTFSALLYRNTLGENDILLPPNYFYSYPYEARKEGYSTYITVNSFAIHLWDHSWKVNKNENKLQLIKNLGTVIKDYIFYSYSTTYAKRYAKEFSRKLYHQLIGKTNVQNLKEKVAMHSLKVVHVSTSHRGGAGIAAFRLHQALKKNGVASAFVSKTLTIDFQGNILKDPFFVYKKPSPVKRVLIKIKSILNPSSVQNTQAKIEAVKENLDYEILTTVFSNYKMHNHPLVKEADILHLHWVSGLINFPTFFSRLKRPVVWTLHDMNPFQGIFHYKNDQIRNYDLIGDLDNDQQKIKQVEIGKITNGALVAPSKWLLNQAKNSNVFSSFNYQCCISYSIDLEMFKPVESKAIICNDQLVNKDALTLLFISDSKAEYRKGADLLEQALEIINEFSVDILVMGNAKLIVENPIVKIIPLGYVNDSKQIVDYYSMADVLVLPSREDNLPNVMLEAMACGIPVIGFAIGGLKEHIINGQTGLLAEEISVLGLKKTIERFHKTRLDYNKENIRSYAEEHFKSEYQATCYLKLYLKLYLKMIE